jgi:hypothetical protein
MFSTKEFYERKIYTLVMKHIYYVASNIVKKFTLVGIAYEGEDVDEHEHEGSPTQWTSSHVWSLITLILQSYQLIFVVLNTL